MYTLRLTKETSSIECLIYTAVQSVILKLHFLVKNACGSADQLFQRLLCVKRSEMKSFSFL